MRLGFKRIAGKLFLAAGLFRLLRIFNRNKLRILTFHNPNLEHFEEQIIFLKKYYNMVSLDNVHDFYHRNKPLPKYPLLITFDDGYLNLKTFVDPILTKHGIKATVFLPTGFIGKKNIAWWDAVEYALDNSRSDSITILGESHSLKKEGIAKIQKIFYHILTNRELEERDNIIRSLLRQTKVSLPKDPDEKYSFLSWYDVKKSSFDFGSHTVSHPILINLDHDLLEKELIDSREEIEKRLGRCRAFCYPNGDHNPIVVRKVKEAGYDLAFSTEWGFCDKDTDPFLLKRIGINKQDDKGILALKLFGIFNIYHSFRQHNEDKKVILATNYYYPQLGGITKSVDSLHRKLKEMGIDSMVYPFPDTFREIEKKAGLLRKFVHRVFVISYIIVGMVKVLAYRILFRRVVVHGHSANFCALFAYISKMFGAKTAYTFHTDIRMEGFSLVHRKPKKMRYFNSIGRLIAVSIFLKRQVKRFYGIGKRVDVIYNGIEIPEKFKKKVPGSILFVGNLISIKDPLTFIESLRILRQRGVSFKAKIVGVGDLEEEVRSKVKEYGIDAEILGRVKHNKVLQLFSESKVYVCSSLGEGLPNTILEAIAHRCRIVSTDVGGIPEIGVQEKGLGTLVSPGKPKEMSFAIASELKKKPLNDPRQALKKFNPDYSGRAHQYIYNDLFIRDIKEEAYSDLMKGGA